MSLITIDDRDVFNYFGIEQQTDKHKELLLQLKSNNSTSRCINLGSGVFKIDIPVIACTGSDINTFITIPFTHVLTKMELKHTDSSDANSVNPLEYTLKRRTSQNLWLVLYQEPIVLKSDIIDEYIGYTHELGQYALITNSTNTEKLFVSFYIKWSGE